ncbi:hypothetical protein ACER0C_022280 [Sarotherodon galilaeus]
MCSRSLDFRVVCGIDDCPSEYRVYNSFYYHATWTHTCLGFQEDGEGYMNLDIYKHATTFWEPGSTKDDAMGVFDQFVDPFIQIASTHLQDKTIKELLKPVEPAIVVAKHTVCYCGDSRVIAIKDHCFHYIPLVKSLEQLLSQPRMLAVIDERPTPCKDGFFHHFIDGDIFNGERTIHWALMSVCGDTLAQHEVAGFKEVVGFAYSKCRHCECHFEDMQEQFDEDLFANTDFLKDNLNMTYGINRRNKLTESPHIDVINQTPQDIMHVILEGFAPYDIKGVLKNLVAILCFPYSPVDLRDKPCPISVSTLSSNDNKLKQSAGQTLVFLKILPFLINKTGENHYTQMLGKMFIKILAAFKTFKQLFPDENIIPKQHYLLHLPSQLRALGPAVTHMCMCFESKPCFFKQWALKSSFKNICKSLVNVVRLRTRNVFQVKSTWVQPLR